MSKRTRLIVSAALLTFAVCLTAVSPMLSAQALNSAPVAENIELRTFRNVCVGGRLSAVDPEGDLLTFSITTQPVKGSIELTEDGRFVYSPDVNRRGRDYFGFKATDANGNASQEATVIIRIEKQKGNVSYSDMAGDAAAYAATAVAEAGIFTGSRLGELWVFEPTRAVTRGEFLAMCMIMRGEDMLSGVLSTGFNDDGDIPMWQKPYVATALMDGLVSGYVSPAGAIFDANEFISCSEAAVLMNSVTKLSEVADISSEAAAPAWAEQSAANLAACGMLPDGRGFDECLTRADAAQMLVSAMLVIDKR
ncbi:MAG: Ig-like domain-containing protein [Oscillospiraceae bacterium]